VLALDARAHAVLQVGGNRDLPVCVQSLRARKAYP